MKRTRICNVSNKICCGDNYELKKCFTSFCLENETKLIKGNNVMTISRLSKEYTVSFEVKLTDVSDLINISPYVYYNVFHLSTNGDTDAYGTRTPAMWIYNGTYHISSAVNSISDYYIDRQMLKPENWNSIKISQQLIEGKYIYSIEHNCTIIFSLENNDPREFSNVKVYVSDPWYDALPGLIRNLKITNGKLVLWAPWSNWSTCNDTYGFMNRTRNCNISNPTDWCDGSSFDLTDCYVLWTEWRTWSTSIDSYELINRTRECNVSYAVDWCLGNSVEILENSAFWSQWSNWSDCNNSNGFKNRRRECITLSFMKWCYTNKFKSVECSELYSMEEETLILTEKLVATIKKLEKEFSIYFETRPIVFLNGFKNVFQLTTGINRSSYGYRIPGVWFDQSGKFFICYDINNSIDHCNYTKPVQLEKWSSIKISQTYLQGKYIYSTELNGEKMFSEENFDARDFLNVKVYVSNPRNDAQIGLIRNLKLNNGNSVFQPMCSNWSICKVIFKTMNKTYDSNSLDSTTVCNGQNSEKFICIPFWSQWSTWTSCNATYGFMNKTRECNISSAIGSCYGNSSEVNECFVFWEQWSNWSGCNEFNRFMNRSRNCKMLNTAEICFGNSSEVMECPVFWSQLSNWTSCNATHGFTNRTRKCNISSAIHGCYGNSSEVKECFAFWSLWSNWTRCNGTYGLINRTRACNISNAMDQCYGNNSEVKECFVFWEQWSNWTGCNEFNRLMRRSRECKRLNTAEICFGNNSEVMECPAYWSEWSSWTICNASHGFVNRTRECRISNSRNWCHVNNSGIIECFALWAQWSNLISCDSSNGLPNESIVMNKFRDCKYSNVIDWCHGNNVDVMEYFDKWTTWSECSVTCGLGNRSRYSQHEKIKVMKVENCYQINCPEDGMWGEWNISECSSTCGKGIKLVNRSCNKPPPSYNGRDCIGVSSYTKVCDNDIICPINGNWSMWTSWSLCSQPCGGRLQSQFRSCSNPVPRFGGRDCSGSSEEFANCSLQNCKSVKLNLNLNFIDEKFEWYSTLTSAKYSTLRDKIQVAVSKLYSNRIVNFYVVINSMKNGP